MAAFNFMAFFHKLFNRGSHHSSTEPSGQPHHLEPKYWQEVIDLRTNLEKVIEQNTIDDDNVKNVNQRVLDFFIDQINQKGSLPSVTGRYAALNTLVDRMLLNYQKKIVGLKKVETTHTDFTDVVTEFKHRLKAREQKELSESAKQRP